MLKVEVSLCGECVYAQLGSFGFSLGHCIQVCRAYVYQLGADGHNEVEPLYRGHPSGRLEVA